ncbi:serine C-palmitoyltransferase LCB1 [Sporobolomyces salmoneus]|uniref:serine C-palmitoyltransferase LCB1 n=1 Tax=Sporobolomyces salmoneus TaxID=183962 RepID=UPI0031752B7D
MAAHIPSPSSGYQAASASPTPSAISFPELLSAFNSSFSHLATLSNRIPGSAIVWRYLKASHQDDPLRTVLEILLVFFIVRTYLMARTKGESSGKNFVKFSEKEIDELVSEWQPEPLLPPNQETPLHPPILVGATGPRPRVIFPQPGQDPHDPLEPLSLDQPGKPVTNLASANFAGLAGNERIKEKAVGCLRRYGVGSCGPAGFYGTFDVHLELERDIAQFLRVPAAINYAQGFSAISSVIPAFCKRGDIVVADRGCNFAIQKGIQISRVNVKWYDHGDYEALERILEGIKKEDKKYRRNPTASRRFIVTEGIFENDGSMVNLPKVMELKHKYKYRLILDEGWSIGAVGKTGRGVTEVFDIPAAGVDIITGTMQNAFSSSGGFCAGSVEVVAHQRINSPTYVFSAALPPLLAVSASEAISLLSTPLTSTDPAHPLSTLPTNIRALRQILDQVSTIEIPSAEMSPLIHFHIKPSVLEKPSSEGGGRSGGRQRSHSHVSHPQPSLIVVPAAGMSSSHSSRSGHSAQPGGDGTTSVESSRQEQERLLQEIVDLCGENGVLLTTTKRTWAQEQGEVRPSIRICVSAALTKKEMEKAGNVVKNAINKVLGKKK